jgi:RNA polymerase sigma-70 factor (ECF subfamily)
VDQIEYDGLSDAEVIQRSLRAGESFAVIFDRHSAAVHAYAARRAGHDVADDVLAEVFLTAFARRKRYDLDVASALPWLYGIAGNLLRRQWRSTKKHLQIVDAVAEQADGAYDSHEERVTERIDASDRWAAVNGVLATLAEGDREALLLFAWEELTYAEIAVALAIPVGTVRSRIHRSRAILRDALGTTMEVPR